MPFSLRKLICLLVIIGSNAQASVCGGLFKVRAPNTQLTGSSGTSGESESSRIAVSVASSDSTDNLISYVVYLFQNGDLNLNDLARIYAELSDESTLQAVNLVSAHSQHISSAKHVHFKRLDELLKDPTVDRSKFKEAIGNHLGILQTEHRERNSVSEDTSASASPIVFQFVPGGKVTLPRDSSKDVQPRIFSLNQDMEFMSTKVTQHMWAQVMGDIPSDTTGFSSEPIVPAKLNGKIIYMQPNNPVTNISYLSAMVFANRLSEIHNLEPVYDLSEMSFFIEDKHWVERSLREPTTKDPDIIAALAARGELAQFHFGMTRPVKIRAPRGDIYLSKGFRIPTAAEHLYLRSIGGTQFKTYYFADTLEQLAHYEDLTIDDIKDIRPISARAPVRFGKSDFFDLMSAVGEMSYTYYPFDAGEQFAPINPLRTTPRSHPALIIAEIAAGRRHDYATRTDILAQRCYFDPLLYSGQRPQCGLRLVRSLQRERGKLKSLAESTRDSGGTDRPPRKVRDSSAPASKRARHP